MKFITMHFRKRVGGSINSSVKFWQFKKMAPLKFGKKKKKSITPIFPSLFYTTTMDALINTF